MVDLQLFRELRLEPVKAIDEHGRMTEVAGPLKGLKVETAREQAIEQLRAGGFLEKLEPIHHTTPICSRTLNPIASLSSAACNLRQPASQHHLRRPAATRAIRPTRPRQPALHGIRSLTI